MRAMSVLAILVGLLAGACAGGPKLREPETIKPKRMRQSCGLVEGTPLSEEQALCVARTSGLNVSEGAYTMRSASTSALEATWIIEEECGDKNPECIGIVVRQSDGAILDTRYLYVIRDYGKK